MCDIFYTSSSHYVSYRQQQVAIERRYSRRKKLRAAFRTNFKATNVGRLTRSLKWFRGAT